MRRVVFTQKGGVGKSSIACNLAAISASQGLRTLVIDLDTQGNASEYLLGQPVSELSDTIEEFFEQSLAIKFLSKKSPSSYVHRTRYENLSVIPAGAGLDFLISKLEAKQKMDEMNMDEEEMERTYQNPT